MKQTKRIYTLLAILVLFSIQLQAQPYKTAVGIRAGYSSGLKVKHFISYDAALDLQALYNAAGFQLVGLYEYEFSPYGPKQVNYFTGGGAYAGNWNDNRAAGLAGILGVEYVLRKVPLSFGIEWKPMLNVWEELDFAMFDLGISISVLIK